MLLLLIFELQCLKPNRAAESLSGAEDFLPRDLLKVAFSIIC